MSCVIHYAVACYLRTLGAARGVAGSCLAAVADGVSLISNDAHHLAASSSSTP
jgi:hypothetical protein